MLYRYRLPILAGVLAGTSYIPFWPWALFFCLVPLWIFVLNAKNLKEVFLGAWITQFILSAIGFNWVAQTAVEIGHFSWFYGMLSLIGFCTVAHLYFPLSAAVWFYINKRWTLGALSRVLLLAMLLAFFTNIYPSLFPWHFGYPWLWVGLPGLHMADWIGFEGLSLVTLIINGLLTVAWIERKKLKTIYRYAGAAVSVFVLVNLVGYIKSENLAPPDAAVKVLVVQGNIGNFEKLEAEKGSTQFRPAIVDRYLDLTKQGLAAHPEAEMIVWPETAFPNYIDSEFRNESAVVRLREFLLSVRRPLITGAYSRNAETRATYNALAVLNSDGELVADHPYRKTIRLAYGEYVPGAEYFPIFNKIFPNVTAIGVGSGPTVIKLNSRQYGLQICYEGIFTWFSNALAKSGAEVFVNVANDSWFGQSFEAYQHLYMTVARAVEFRIPLIRSTNTGITTVGLANGRVLEFSPQNQEWFGLYEVPYRRNPPLSIYSYVEPIWYLLLLLMSGFVIWRGKEKPRKNKKPAV